MTKSVTVNFDDGTSHVYDNVPDDVSDEDVSARASTEFEGKTISGLGAGTTAATEVKPAIEPTMGEKAMAAAQTGLGVVQQALPVATTAAELYGLYKGGQLVNKYLDAKNTAQAASQAPIGTPRQTPGTKIPINWNPGATPVVPASMNQLPVSATNVAAPNNPNLAPPAVGGPAAQQGSNFIQNIAQKYATLAGRVAKSVPAAQMGMGVLYTSPEEIATLKAAEERKRQAMMNQIPR